MRHAAAFAVFLALLPVVGASKPASKVFGPGGIRVLEAPTAKERQRECRQAKVPKGCEESDEAFIQVRLARVARQAKAVEAQCTGAPAQLDKFPSLLRQFGDLSGEVSSLTLLTGRPMALEIVLARMELLDASERCIEAWHSPEDATPETFDVCHIGGGCWHAYGNEPPEISYREPLADALEVARTRTGIDATVIARGEDRLRRIDEAIERRRTGFQQCLIDCRDPDMRKGPKPEMVPSDAGMPPSKP